MPLVNNSASSMRLSLAVVMNKLKTLSLTLVINETLRISEINSYSSTFIISMRVLYICLKSDSIFIAYSWLFLSTEIFTNGFTALALNYFAGPFAFTG